MASVNKVILMGNLGRDPELRTTPSGASVCAVSIATTSRWKDKTSGERMEETEWHRVVFWNRLAEIASEYLQKGKPVYIEGSLKTRKYTDKDGVEKYATEIVATEMQLLGGRDDGHAPAPAPAQQRRAPSPAPAPARRQASQASQDQFDDDDIPF